MKKIISLLNAIELMKQLGSGKRVEGVLYIDRNTGKLTFKPYNRTAPKNRRKPDELICYLDYGWVKKSARRIKIHDSIPDKLGAARIISIMERDIAHAKVALIDRELFPDQNFKD